MICWRWHSLGRGDWLSAERHSLSPPGESPYHLTPVLSRFHGLITLLFTTSLTSPRKDGRTDGRADGLGHTASFTLATTRTEAKRASLLLPWRPRPLSVAPGRPPSALVRESTHRRQQLTRQGKSKGKRRWRRAPQLLSGPERRGRLPQLGRASERAATVSVAQDMIMRFERKNSRRRGRDGGRRRRGGRER